MIIKHYRPIKNLNLRELPINVKLLEKLNILDKSEIKSSFPKGERAGTCFSESLLITERNPADLTSKIVFQSI